jgi:hypothetical protein
VTRKSHKYDLNKDGVVTEEELAMAKAIYEAEALSRKQSAQKKMAWAALTSMVLLVSVLLLPLVPESRVGVLGSVIEIFLLSMASVIGAYMGFTAYMNRTQK